MHRWLIFDSFHNLDKDRAGRNRKAWIEFEMFPVYSMLKNGRQNVKRRSNCQIWFYHNILHLWNACRCWLLTWILSCFVAKFSYLLKVLVQPPWSKVLNALKGSDQIFFYRNHFCIYLVFRIKKHAPIIFYNDIFHFDRIDGIAITKGQ